MYHEYRSCKDENNRQGAQRGTQRLKKEKGGRTYLLRVERTRDEAVPAV